MTMVTETKPKQIIEGVTAFADSFLIRNGYMYKKLKSVEYDESKKIWNLTFDVGVLGVEIKTVKIDDESGKVVGFK